MSTILLCDADAVVIVGAIYIACVLIYLVYYCCKHLAAPAASAVKTTKAPLQNQETPVIVVQPGEQVKPEALQHLV